MVSPWLEKDKKQCQKGKFDLGLLHTYSRFIFYGKNVIKTSSEYNNRWYFLMRVGFEKIFLYSINFLKPAFLNQKLLQSFEANLQVQDSRQVTLQYLILFFINQTSRSLSRRESHKTRASFLNTPKYSKYSQLAPKLKKATCNTRRRVPFSSQTY